jgi:hypothetical protein
MTDPTPESPGIAALRDAIKKLREALPSKPVEETEERRQLRKKFRRKQLAKKLTKFAAVLVLVFATYSLLKQNSAVRHWLIGFLPQPESWWGNLLAWSLIALGGLPAVVLLFYFPWLAIEWKEPSEKTQWWTATAVWALLLLVIILAVRFGKYDPDPWWSTP